VVRKIQAKIVYLYGDLDAHVAGWDDCVGLEKWKMGGSEFIVDPMPFVESEHFARELPIAASLATDCEIQ
jgi:hypothetical protein